MLVMPNQCRVAIAGASSLRGKELAAVLDERGFPSTDIRLLDDEVAEGALTEAGGEAAVIRGVDEDSFQGVRFAFFAGTRDFTRRHWRQASHAGATLIDLSGELNGQHAVPFIPALRTKLPPPQAPNGKLLASPPAATIIACTIATALREISLKQLVIVFFQPVSERGQQAVDELESQTINLLSLKPFSQDVFGAQVAFNLLGSYGEESRERLADVSGAIAAQAAQYLAGRVPTPAVQLIQAPVFYGYAFAAYAETASPCHPGDIERALEAVGTKVGGTLSDAPSNVSVAGENQIAIGHVEPDVNHPNGFWLWGAADNMRLAASNAVSIAETLVAS